MHTRNEKIECSAVFFYKNVPLSTCLFAYYALSYCANIPKENTNTCMKSNLLAQILFLVTHYELRSPYRE